MYFCCLAQRMFVQLRADSYMAAAYNSEVFFMFHQVGARQGAIYPKKFAKRLNCVFFVD